MTLSKEKQELAEKEKRIFDETERIEAAEVKIEKEEKKILKAEKTILEQLRKNAYATAVQDGLTIREVRYLHKLFVKKLTRKKFLFSLLFTVGVVLVWRGLWNTADEMPILSISIVSLVVGFVILWLLEKMTDIN